MDRYDKRKGKIHPERFVSNDRRRSQSPSTDQDVPSRRCRVTNTPARYSQCNAQIMGCMPRDPYRITIHQKFDEHGEPEGEQEVLLRRIKALKRRQGQGNLLIRNSGSPFSDAIRGTCFSKKFRMPHMEQFKANTDPQEHVRRY